MMEFGKSLRAAREAKDYTVQQLAELTRMAPTLISDLEADDFSHIAAPIYGRGFVKLYCETVGLEPKPFIDEFMEIVNGNRTPRIKERNVPPAAEDPTPAPTTVETAPEQPETEAAPQQDLFAVPPSPPEQAENATFESLGQGEPSLSRYATPFRNAREVPPAIWRIGALALGALIVLVLLILGLRALHHATMPDAVPAEAETKPVQAKVKPTASETAAPVTSRAQQKIPGLYID